MNDKIEPSVLFVEQYRRLKEEGVIPSDAQFSKIVGWSTSSLSQALSGKRAAPERVIRAFAELYDIPLSSVGLEPLRTPEIIKEEDIVYLVDRYHQPTYGRRCNDQEYIHSLPKFGVFFISAADVRMFEKAGDAMAPTITPGCLLAGVFIPKENWQKQMVDGNAYIIVREGDVLVRRVHKHGKHIELKADNSFYPDITIEWKDIKEVWRINSVTHYEIPSPGSNRMDELEKRIRELAERLTRMGLPG